MADQYAVADTSVLSRLTKVSRDSAAYNSMLGVRRLAVSFQTEPELGNAPFGAARRRRLEELLAVTLKLPHSESTGVWYGRVAARRQELKKMKQPGGEASDADVWIISSALEYRCPLLSHDKQQVYLGRAIGLKVLTNLEGIRDDNPEI